MYERRFYYSGLLNLYLDNLVKTKDCVYAININSSMVENRVLVNTMWYLLLIDEESHEDEDRDYI